MTLAKDVVCPQGRRRSPSWRGRLAAKRNAIRNLGIRRQDLHAAPAAAAAASAAAAVPIAKEVVRPQGRQRRSPSWKDRLLATKRNASRNLGFRRQDLHAAASAAAA